MSTLALLVVAALCLVTVLVAQEDITDVCDYPCAQEIFNERCGGAVCPLPKSPSQNELDTLCSLNCLYALQLGEVSGCIADADVWRPLIDEHVLGLHADVLAFCVSNGVEIEAPPSKEAPLPEEAEPSYSLDENDIDEIVEADLLDG